MTSIPSHLAHAAPSAAHSQYARERLEAKIEAGRKSALDLFERVHRDAPRDSLVRGRAIEFKASEKAEGRLVLDMRLGDGEIVGIHQHALGQLAQRAGIPGAYLNELVAGQPWQVGLASTILAKHYGEGEEASSRFLVRQVGGQARGVLSDKYRRLDSRPLVEAFAQKCQEVGAVPIDGTVTDTRVALKAIVPTVLEPVPGELIALGVEWGNSDFGNGMHALRAFILRLVCLNGATLENALAQVHLGGRLADEFEMSQRTYELDTKASVSALQDVVHGILAPAKIEQLTAGIRRAHEKGVEWKSVRTALAKRLLKSELDAAQAAYESEDVINLPAGHTMWRASNALSWIAGNTQDTERKLELERLAGELVSGKREVEAAAA